MVDDSMVQSAVAPELGSHRGHSHPKIDAHPARASVPPVCPYCNTNAVLLDPTPAEAGDLAAYPYKKYYGPLWVCSHYPTCNAYVGCHPGTTMALGRLADKELRLLKSQVHAVFDPLWMYEHAIRKRRYRRRGNMKNIIRNKWYEWLAGKLGIPVEQCHIGMFDNDTCQRAIEICKNHRGKRTC